MSPALKNNLASSISGGMKSRLTFGHTMSAGDTELRIDVVLREGRKVFQLALISEQYSIVTDMSNADFQNFMRLCDNVMSDFIGGVDHGDGG